MDHDILTGKACKCMSTLFNLSFPPIGISRLAPVAMRSLLCLKFELPWYTGSVVFISTPNRTSIHTPKLTYVLEVDRPCGFRTKVSISALHSHLGYSTAACGASLPPQVAMAACYCQPSISWLCETSHVRPSWDASARALMVQLRIGVRSHHNSLRQVR